MIDPDTIGWFGTVAFAVASIGIAHKRVWGMGLCVVANIFFLAVGVLTGLTSLIATSILLSALDVYALVQWRKDD